MIRAISFCKYNNQLARAKTPMMNNGSQFLFVKEISRENIFLAGVWELARARQEEQSITVMGDN